MELGSWASGQTSSPAGLTSGDTGGRVTSFRPRAEIEQAAPISSCCEPGASKFATASLQTDLEGHGKFHSSVLSPVGGVVRRPLPLLCLSLSTDQGQRHFRLVGRDTDPRDSDSVGWGRVGTRTAGCPLPRNLHRGPLHCLVRCGGALPHSVPLRVGGPSSEPAMHLGLGLPAHCPSLEAS